MAFNDRAFSKLNQTSEGQRIWALVRRPDIQQDLITAARLGRPSVEILADDLFRSSRQLRSLLIPLSKRRRTGAHETTGGASSVPWLATSWSRRWAGALFVRASGSLRPIAFSRRAQRFCVGRLTMEVNRCRTRPGAPLRLGPFMR